MPAKVMKGRPMVASGVGRKRKASKGTGVFDNLKKISPKIVKAAKDTLKETKFGSQLLRKLPGPLGPAISNWAASHGYGVVNLRSAKGRGFFSGLKKLGKAIWEPAKQVARETKLLSTAASKLPGPFGPAVSDYLQSKGYGLVMMK